MHIWFDQCRFKEWYVCLISKKSFLVEHPRVVGNAVNCFQRIDSWTWVFSDPSMPSSDEDKWLPESVYRRIAWWFKEYEAFKCSKSVANFYKCLVEIFTNLDFENFLINHYYNSYFMNHLHFHIEVAIVGIVIIVGHGLRVIVHIIPIFAIPITI